LSSGYTKQPYPDYRIGLFNPSENIFYTRSAEQAAADKFELLLAKNGIEQQK
jgi:hypothetical protein